MMLKRRICALAFWVSGALLLPSTNGNTLEFVCLEEFFALTFCLFEALLLPTTDRNILGFFLKVFP